MAIKLTFSKPRVVLDKPSYFPNVIKLSTGELFVQCMWGNDRQPTNEEYEEFYSHTGPTTAEDWMKYNAERQAKSKSYVHVLSGWWAYSNDGGKTYTETGLPPIIEYVEKENGDVVGLQWYSWKDSKNENQIIVRSWTSHDKCRSWDAPVDIPLDMPAIPDDRTFHKTLIVPHRRILHLEGDTYLVLMYGRFEGDEHDRSTVFRTTDGFKTLHYFSTCGMWREGIENSAGLNETDMCRVPDGRLLTVMRNQGGYPMYQAHSSDNGASWTPVTRFSDMGVDPALCVLQNGVVVCSYGRPGVKVAFSENGGDDWQKHTTIQMGAFDQNGSEPCPVGALNSRSCSYTDVTETAPNTATVYYSAPVDWADNPKWTPWDPNQRDYFRIYAIDVTVEKY